MLNTNDYIDWRGDLSFEASPCNEVDMSIFTHLSTLDLNGILDSKSEPTPLKTIANAYFEKQKDKNLGVLQPGRIPDMLRKMAVSSRYSNLLLSNAESKIDTLNNEQFAALTILLPDKTICVSYRGTDDTLVGWKEDCNLAIYNSVPAQEDALDYLTRVSSEHKGKIRICGHSKGGNLAVSAAVSANSRIKKRIIQVDNFDGPGFSQEYLQSENYIEMKDRITSYLSQYSMIGILLYRPGKVVYTNSSVSGPFAHDSFNWEVLGTEFVKCEELSPFSARLDRAINTTISGMTTEEKQQFVEELFNTLSLKGAQTVTELTKMKVTDMASVLMSINGDKQVKAFISKVIKALTKEYIPPAVPKLISKINPKKD